MFPNSANLAMGHELIGLCRLEQNLARLEDAWPDGAYVMRCLLSGQTRIRANGSLPISLLPRIHACHQPSCHLVRSVGGSHPNLCTLWPPCVREDLYIRPIPISQPLSVLPSPLTRHTRSQLYPLS